MPPMLLSWISPTHPPLVAKHDGGCPWWLQFSAVLQDSIISFPLYLLKFSYSRETGQDWSTHDTNTITCGQHMTHIPSPVVNTWHPIPSSVVNTWLHYHLLWSTHDSITIFCGQHMTHTPSPIFDKHTCPYHHCSTHMSISSLLNTQYISLLLPVVSLQSSLSAGSALARKRPSAGCFLCGFFT